MADFDPNIVSRRIEEFRKSLLDTSLRNRLINFRARTKSGKSLEKVVEVYDAIPADILQRLVVEGKSMSFTGRPDPKHLTPDENFDTYEEALLLFDADATADVNFLDSANHNDEAGETIDSKLSTGEFRSVLNRKLTKIERDAKLSLEEQGVNVLYLALGMLEWYEDEKSEELRRAPLIMVPVTLERTANGACRLRWDGSE